MVALSTPYIDAYNELGFPWNKDSLLKLFKELLRDKRCYFKGFFINDELHGWMAATVGHSNPHSFVRGMSQIFYHSDLKGRKAIAALKEMHEDYYRYAEDRKVQVVVTSSILPSKDNFVRLLEREGWLVIGDGRLARFTKWHPDKPNCVAVGVRSLRTSGGETGLSAPKQLQLPFQL